MKRSILIETITQSANKLKGPVLDLGFNNGRLSTSLLSSMINGKIPPRPFYIYGDFSKEVKNSLGKATDIINESKNRFKLESKLTFIDLYRGSLPSINFVPSIAIVDCGSNTYNSIVSIYNKLLEGALIMFPSYNNDQFIHDQVDKFVSSNLIEKEFVITDEFSYIKRGPVSKKLINKGIDRERSLNLT